MKKAIFLLCLAVGFLSCTKEPVTTQESATGVPMNFEISVAETKADKTTWADGDKIYVFFKGLAAKYLVMTYNATTGWANTSGGDTLLDTDFSSLETKTLTAVHFPVNVKVTYDNGRFSFANSLSLKPVYNYYLFQTGNAYTVAGATVTATLTMGKPADMVQIHVAGIQGEVSAYTFGCSKIRPVACKSVGTDGTITENVLHAGALLSGIADSDGGIFAGRLTDPGVETNYTFTVTDNSNIYTLTRSNRALTAGKMYNFPALSETGGANWSVSAKDSEYTDLSAEEAANTYIVSSAGKYKFNATIKGNGGLDPLTGTTATTIDPADISGVAVLWEQYNDKARGITEHHAITIKDNAYDISYSSNGYVTFSTPSPFYQGAACVAIFKDGVNGTAGVYDKDHDKILWSWLLWLKNDWGETIHKGKTFMNCNLGATYRESYYEHYKRGFLYQWGRKDAFSAAVSEDHTNNLYWFSPLAGNVFVDYPTEAQSMANAIAHPTARIVCRTETVYSWMQESEYSKRPWREDVKTIYDPCPPGWKVPSHEDMNGMDGKTTGLFNTGCYLGSNSSNNLRNFGSDSSNYGYYWTSTISTESAAKSMYLSCKAGTENSTGHALFQTEGCAIRPVRE